MTNEFLNDPAKMRPEQILLTARNSLECFGYAIQPNFECAPHHRLMVERIEQLLRGRIRKVAIIAPPRHGKSNLASILLPAYQLGRDPRSSIICASYAGELSESFGRKVRNIVASSMFNAIFPNCQLSPDSAAAHRFSTTGGGEYAAVGRNGPLTGRGASLLVLDDLIKDEAEARSEVICRGIIDWIQSTALTRLTPSGKVLAIATRWSARDPMGWLLQQRGFEVLHLPAVSLGDGDPLGRPQGTALWESQFPLPVLSNIRAAVGLSVWNCLYQGDPIAAAGDVFQRGWFKYYDSLPAKFSKIIQSWDTAFKVGASNDFSVCSTWGVTDSHFYLLHLWRDKVEFPELKKRFIALAETWNPTEILLEDKSSGISLAQELEASTTFPVIPIRPDGDKTARANAVTPYFESGKVLFPRDAEWLADLEDELCAFPRGAHDDQTDSISQALNRLRDRGGIYGVLDWAAGIMKGIFTRPEPSPERLPGTDNQHSKEIFEQTRRLHQLTDKPTSGGHAAFKKDEPTPPCPKCKATITVRIGGGGIRCNQCGHQFDEPGTEQEVLFATRDRGLVLKKVKRS